MAKRRKPKKRRVSIKVTQKAQVVRKDSISKDSVRSDTLKKVQGRPPADIAPTFRIKVRRKK